MTPTRRLRDLLGAGGGAARGQINEDAGMTMTRRGPYVRWCLNQIERKGRSPMRVTSSVRLSSARTIRQPARPQNESDDLKTHCSPHVAAREYRSRFSRTSGSHPVDVVSEQRYRSLLDRHFRCRWSGGPVRQPAVPTPREPRAALSPRLRHPFSCTRRRSAGFARENRES